VKDITRINKSRGKGKPGMNVEIKSERILKEGPKLFTSEFYIGNSTFYIHCFDFPPVPGLQPSACF
jgi:hypothetical protein